MKAEMRRCGIGAEDPRKIQACFQQLKDANYDAEEVIAGYANIEALRKERMDLDEERLTFEAKLATVKDVLPLDTCQITTCSFAYDFFTEASFRM